MKYIDNNSLPIPIAPKNNATVAISTPAAQKLQKMATCHDTAQGRKWVNSLSLAAIVNSKPTHLRLAINQAGESVVHKFLTSQFEYIAQTLKGFDPDKTLTIADCEALASIAIDDFGLVLQPKDVILFTQAFKAGYIKTSGGKTYKMPELYGRITQREIADGLQIYSKAKAESVREKNQELNKIADYYETQVSKICDKDRQKLRVWAMQNNQHALIAKINLYERYLSGDLAKSAAEAKALPPVQKPEPQYAGTRLAKLLGIEKSKTESLQTNK